MPLQKPSATFRLCKRLFEFSPSIVASSIVADIVRDLISVSQGISMPSHIDSSGYSQEEAIFKKKELEQLAQIRAELDVKRKANETAAAKAVHWMRCPKCGGAMQEKRLENIVADHCNSCGGLFFDAGELDILLKHEKVNSGIFGRLFGS